MSLPTSTVDPDLSSGAEIPIEQRDPDEVRVVGPHRIVSVDVPAAHPAFDVTPHGLLTGIVTERGVLHPPFRRALERALS